MLGLKVLDCLPSLSGPPVEAIGNKNVSAFQAHLDSDRWSPLSTSPSSLNGSLLWPYLLFHPCTYMTTGSQQNCLLKMGVNSITLGDAHSTPHLTQEKTNVLGWPMNSQPEGDWPLLLAPLCFHHLLRAEGSLSSLPSMFAVSGLLYLLFFAPGVRRCPRSCLLMCGCLPEAFPDHLNARTALPATHLFSLFCSLAAPNT